MYLVAASQVRVKTYSVTKDILPPFNDEMMRKQVRMEGNLFDEIRDWKRTQRRIEEKIQFCTDRLKDEDDAERLKCLFDELQTAKDELVRCIKNLKEKESELKILKEEYEEQSTVTSEVMAHFWRTSNIIEEMTSDFPNVKKILWLMDRGTNFQGEVARAALRKKFRTTVGFGKYKIFSKKKTAPKTDDILPHERIIAKIKHYCSKKHQFSVERQMKDINKLVEEFYGKKENCRKLFQGMLDRCAFCIELGGKRVTKRKLSIYRKRIADEQNAS